MVCAILLDKDKYDVEIIEQASQFRNIGFSIVMWKTGFEHLLSLLKKNYEHIVEGKDYFKLDGFKLFVGARLFLLKKFNVLGYGWAFERTRLMKILENVLHKQIPKQQVSFSKTIRHIEYAQSQGGCALVKFRDGTESAYDVVIIAEGIHSSSRELVAVNERIISVPYALRYSWFASPTNLGSYGGLFFTKGQVAVIHPPYFKNLLGFYFDKGLPRELQSAFENSVRVCIKQLDGRESSLDIQTSDVFELKEVHLDRYYSKNVVFIGDAAHGRPPTLGFGTSLALEDAVFISRKLNELNEISETEITKAFQSYSDIRSKRVEDVYHVQNQIQKFYTKSAVKVIVLSLLTKLFLGDYMEYRIKKLASYTL